MAAPARQSLGDRLGEAVGEALEASPALTGLLQLGPGALPPPSVLSVASVIGLAMVAQQLVRPGGEPGERRTGEGRRRGGGIRRRLPTPFSRLEDHPTSWFDNPDYEYIDQEEVEELRGRFENNRKTSEDTRGEVAGLDMDFDTLDYDNYDYAEVGILDFKETPPSKKGPTNKLSKRQQWGGRAKVHMARRRPQVLHGSLQRRVPRVPWNRLRSRVGTSPFLEGLGSRFDFGTMVSIAGFWYIWQAYLSGYVPTTILQDLVNNVGNFGRSAETKGELTSILRQIIQMQDSVRDELEGR